MNFMQALRDRWSSADSLVCVGLDPEPAKFPAQFANDPDAVFNFCRAIVDATAAYACAFKPQIAHFAALGAEDALQRLIAHIHAAHPGIPVILDSKRGDIGSTAQHYAAEAFDRHAADAVTVNPYLGRDSLQPFLDRADKGVIVLCRTSNPGAGDLQDLRARVRQRPRWRRAGFQTAVPARRRESRARMERQRQLRAGRRCDLARAVARSARDRRRRAVPGAGRRRAGRRCRGRGHPCEDRRWHRAGGQFLAGDPVCVVR